MGFGIWSRVRKFVPDLSRRGFLERNFTVFAPASAGHDRYPGLTYRGANDFPAALLRLLSTRAAPPMQEMSAADFGMGHDGGRLAAALNEHGKGSPTESKAAIGYDTVYARIIDEICAAEQSPRLLEIGIGTNNPSVVSTMGVGGTPGASLRAFRDAYPTLQVFGADYDKGVLFQDGRIRTAFVDQTLPSSFDVMLADLGATSFDLIIDDGLHAPIANLNTLHFALGHLRPGGWAVIEDIPERSIDVWRVVGRILPGNLQTFLLKARSGYLFAVRTSPATQARAA